MEISKKKLVDLKPAPYNPRQSTKKQEDDLKKSLKKFGLVEPIIFNKQTGYIVGGHFRVRELIKLGHKEADCVIVDLNEEDEKELNIRLNANTGEWDNDILANEWDYDLLQEWGLDVPVAGFEEIDPEKEAIEDDVPTAPENIVVEKGDVFQLGEHRLMCGDSTSIDDVEKLMDGEKADMVYTDPPYGMFLDTDYSDMSSKFKGSTGGNKYDTVKGDAEDFNPLFILLPLKEFSYCKEIFLWGADYYAELLEDKNKGSWVVWDKRLEDSADKMYGSCFELCWSKARHKRDIARIKWAGIFGMEKEFDKKRTHPTQKPVGLSKWFIEKYSKEGGKIVDLFGGSGGTLIASDELGRKCFMQEYEPKYIQVIIKRFHKYTDGKKEIKCLNRKLDISTII